MSVALLVSLMGERPSLHPAIPYRRTSVTTSCKLPQDVVMPLKRIVAKHHHPLHHRARTIEFHFIGEECLHA